MTADPTRHASTVHSSVAPTGKLGFRGRQATPEERERILDQLFFEGSRRLPYLQRFVVLMIFASAIAAGGLANDSAAVVIGAMLIAPLMTPILGAAAALVMGQPRRMLDSLSTTLGGALVAIVVGIGLALVEPRLTSGAPLPDELVARTTPNLTDLLIALAAGAAGAFVTIRSEAGSALPGVGIAVALVPPLAAMGMTLALGDWSLALGAGLLFTTNLIAIILAGGVVFVLGGYEAYMGRLGQRRARRAWAQLLVAIVIIAVPLAWQTRSQVDQGRTTAATTRAVAAWAPDLTVTDLNVNIAVEPIEITVGVTGAEPPAHVDKLAGMLAQELDRAVGVDVIYSPSARADAPAP